jgi:hypothetical protein
MDRAAEKTERFVIERRGRPRFVDQTREDLEATKRSGFKRRKRLPAATGCAWRA